MIKTYLMAALTALLLFPLGMKAIPAYPVRKTLTLEDGTTVMATLTGDEHLHYFKSEDGRAFNILANGKARLIPEAKFDQLRETAAQEFNASNVRRAKRLSSRRVNYTGKKKGLVILVNFSDNSFTVSDPKTTFNDFFNKEGYSDYGMTGSVTDYFKAQSYGQFELDFDVVGPYTLSKAMWYYGGTSDSGAQDRDPWSMIQEAVKAADPEVNYADYDWDNDGSVDQVFVIYAGYGENYGASSTCVWPHESSIANYNLQLDGKKIGTYACSCELKNSSGSTVDGIGAACHEFTHCLGIQDHYDTSGENFAMGYWDMMCQACYLNNACTPAGYTAFERLHCGWLEPIELTTQTNVTDMKALVDAPEAYILYNEGNRNEFYLLENRQQTGWDKYLYGHGMIVNHVDFDLDTWNANKMNTEADHQRMTIIPADASLALTFSSLGGDPFPGTKSVTSLTNHTASAAKVYNANTDGSYFMNKSIEHITETDGKISFLACRPDLVVPEPEASILSANSFKVEWPAVTDATKYELQVTEYSAKGAPSEARVLNETFTKCYAKTDGFVDLASNNKLSSYLDNAGFSGSKLYTGKSGLLCGTAVSNGSLQAPTQKALSTGDLTVVLGVAPYKAGTSVSGTIVFKTNTSTESVEFSFSQAGNLIFHSSSPMEGLYYIRFNMQGRMYFTSLQLYDGSFTADELGIEVMNEDASARTAVSLNATQSSQIEETSQNMAQAPRKTTTKTLTTTETSYTFTDMVPTSRYEIIVRSRDSERYSEWSNLVNVDLSTPVEAVKAAAPTTTSAIYDLSGRRLNSTTSRGLYIKEGRKYIQQ